MVKLTKGSLSRPNQHVIIDYRAVNLLSPWPEKSATVTSIVLNTGNRVNWPFAKEQANRVKQQNKQRNDLTIYAGSGGDHAVKFKTFGLVWRQNR